MLVQLNGLVLMVPWILNTVLLNAVALLGLILMANSSVNIA